MTDRSVSTILPSASNGRRSAGGFQLSDKDLKAPMLAAAEVFA